MRVKTGSSTHAPTDAKVSIELNGDLGGSGKLALTDSNHANPFELDQLDVFALGMAPLGNINNIIISHDNSGKAQ